MVFLSYIRTDMNSLQSWCTIASSTICFRSTRLLKLLGLCFFIFFFVCVIKYGFVWYKIVTVSGAKLGKYRDSDMSIRETICGTSHVWVNSPSLGIHHDTFFIYCSVSRFWFISKRQIMNITLYKFQQKKNQCLLFKIKTFSALQDHKSRSVQFRTCVKYVKLYASCELHRPAFMTLEPIRFC